jgi:single-stranded-DNA-specific exonuclease
MIRPIWHTLDFDADRALEIARSLEIAPLFGQLLAQRGIVHEAEAREFLQPDLSRLHDPFLMRDMDRAVERLERAIQTGERILLYGDYDVDGTTSVALMYAFLSVFYKNIDYYLPDRDKEGYGISREGVTYARQNGCSLVIAMDCGIKAHGTIAGAAAYGIDFIVCDHHVPEGALPPAYANLDPKRSDCPYPYKELSGCGIAFKFAQAFARRHHTPVEHLNYLLDLVAVSIACDIVPMTGENRILAHHGLKKFNQDPRVGFWALVQRSNRHYPLTINDIVFGVGPLINAAGRLGDAREAVKLLLSADKQSALDNAGALVEINRQRREVDFATSEEARRRFLAMPDWATRKSIVLYEPEWHKGIIGIAASRMAESFHRPAVILTQSDDHVVGSARSVPGFDLYDALQRCEELFYSFGGHAHAAGMQMPPENVAEFTRKFEEFVQNKLSPEAERPMLAINAELPLHQVTPAFWRMLKQFAPFGPHNLAPVFIARNIVDTGRSRLLENNHVRFAIQQKGSSKIWTGIGFGIADTFNALRHEPFDMAFSLQEGYWRGEKILSLSVKDIRPC